MDDTLKFFLSSGVLLFFIVVIALAGWLRRHDAQPEDEAAEEELVKIAEKKYRQKFARTPPAGLRLAAHTPEKKRWGSKP
jgi:hypothetical protein